MRRTKSSIDVNRGTWTPAEDLLLKTHIQIHGEGHWNSIASKSGLQRTGKSCRLRWMNYLRPSVKRGHISADEEELIIRLHKLLGNRWSLIAGRMPGRTDSEIKNYWNTHLSKKVVRKDPKCTKQGYTYNVCAVTDVQHLSDQNEKVSSESEREREKTMMDNTIDINELMGDYSVCNLKDQTSSSYEEIERDEDIQWNISSNWESATYQLSGYEDALLQDFSMGMEKISYMNNDTNNMYHFESLPNSSLLLSRFINPHNFCCSSPFNITSDEARFPYTAEEISANPQTQTEISTLFFSTENVGI